jgi:A/G-specific adenine glycosylase
VWLSEIMLQQTTVAAVGPYFQAFLARWPSVERLAEAPLAEVLAAWAGLGYYARARNLHACARVVAGEYGGRFPEDEPALLKLPGIGPYTAAAIAAIAFDRPAVVVDGNVERVVARLFAVETPLPAAKVELRRLARRLLPAEEEAGFRYGDLAQATMDLGATVCRAGRPRCAICPLAAHCRGSALGLAESLPARAPKRPRPRRRGVAFWIERDDGAVLLRRRPPRGLLGGLLAVPTSAWLSDSDGEKPPLEEAPATLDWQVLDGRVHHTFTHFHLELEVWRGRLAPGAALPEGEWWEAPRLDGAGLPSLMRKVVRYVQASDSRS